VSFGQKRVLVVWTDIIFPNGSTLQIGGMSGTDAQGHSGFGDKVNNHYLKTFGSAVLIALIGTGIDMAVPESSTLATQDTASDATRRNFVETFGRVADRPSNGTWTFSRRSRYGPGISSMCWSIRTLFFLCNTGTKKGQARFESCQGDAYHLEAATLDFLRAFS